MVSYGCERAQRKPTFLEKALSIPPIDVQTTLERSKKLREMTAHYVITADEIERMIAEGRE